MGSPLKTVTNAVGDVFDAVGDAVKDVADVVEDTAKAVAKNPEMLVIAVAAPQLLPAIGVTGAAIAPVTAGLITASQGGDIEDIGKSALTAYVAPQVGAAAGQAVGQATAGSALQNTLANAAGGAAASATAAAISGGDIVESALLGGLTSGVTAGAKDIGIEAGLEADTAARLANIAGGATAGAITGDVEAGIERALLSELNKELKNLANQPAEPAQPPDMVEQEAGQLEPGGFYGEQQLDIGFGPGQFTPDLTVEDIIGMPEDQFDRMMQAIEQDLSQEERQELEEFAPDYSLTAGTTRPPVQEDMGAQGLQADLAELPPEEEIGVTPIDFENIFQLPEEDRGIEEMGGAQGIRVPEVPGLDEMGGGTGLTVPQEGGTVTEEGFVPEDEILRQIEEELYPTPDFEGEDVDVEPTDLSSIRITTAGQTPQGMMREAAAGAPSISSRVTGEAGAGILGDKEPLFGGDEDEQRAVWNRRSLRLRRALGL